MAQFTNQAQLSYNNTVTSSNVAIGEITEVLSATKTAVNTVYSPENNRVTYVVSIVNTGTSAYTNLTLTDTLGEYTSGTLTLYPLNYVSGTLLYYINGTLQTATPTVTAGPPLVISGISVPAGGTATIIYEASVTEYASRASGATIENVATVNGDNITAFTADATITADAEPQLSVTKSISPVPVTENGTLTYTFLIQNTGNAEATADDNAIITDTFDPVLSNLTVTFNGTTWTEGTEYTYTNGVFTTTAGEITVPAATYTQSTSTGVWTTTPGMSTLIVSGTVA